MPKEPDRNQRKALGKGLSALLPSRVVGAAPPPEAESVTTHAEPDRPPLPANFEDFQSLPLDQIQPNEEQPRTSFDDDKLEELTQSIRANGLMQPVTVYRAPEGGYRLIAGERRWRAAKLAGLETIPALVRTVETHQLLELALIENIQREDLNAIEIATAFQNLVTQHQLSHEQIAERTGKDRSTVTNFLRLLRLSAYVRNALIQGSISMGHARALLNITDENTQEETCRQIVEMQLSVRNTEKLVKMVTAPGRDPEAKQEAHSEEKVKLEGAEVDPNVRAALDDMAMALGTRVKMVAKSATTGRIEIGIIRTKI